MRTKTITLYQFNELSEEAKQTAIAKYRRNQQEHGEYLFFFKDNCIEKASEQGYKDIELKYSLNYCQGDGLSFSCGEVSKEKLAGLFSTALGAGKEKTARLLADNCTVTMKGNEGHYAYAHTNQVELLVEGYTSGANTDMERINELTDKVRELLAQDYVQLCKELERIGYADIKYQDSDEAIIESLQDDCEFTEDGERA